MYSRQDKENFQTTKQEKKMRVKTEKKTLSKSTQRRFAMFTLIELLVVIAIIAILA